MESLAVMLLPPDVSALAGIGLVALSLFTSALTAAAGIGGGLVLLSVMASFLPPIVVIPTHGVVQLGSNAGRAVLLRHRTRMRRCRTGSRKRRVARAITT